MTAPSQTPGGRTGSAAGPGRVDRTEHDEHDRLAWAELALAGAVLVGAVAVGRLVARGLDRTGSVAPGLTTVVGYVHRGPRASPAAAASRGRRDGRGGGAGGGLWWRWPPSRAWGHLVRPAGGRTPHRVDLALQGVRPVPLGGGTGRWPRPSGVVLLAALVCGPGRGGGPGRRRRPDSRRLVPPTS